MMNRRDDLRKRDPTSPELPRLNNTIQNRICVHKRQKWRDFVETMDQKTDVTKLWRTIKGTYGRAKREAENEAITFNGISFSSSKQLATKFNQLFNTSKLGRHTSSSPLQPLGHNLSDSSYMEVIINHPHTETGQGHLPRNFLPANLVNLASSKSLGISVLTINQQISHPCSRPTGFRREHSTTSALLQLTTDVAVGFNQRKPPDRAVCVAVDLSAAFDTVCLTTCYQSSTDLSSLRPLHDGSPVI